MVVSILANVGILMISLYTLVKFNGGYFEQQMFSLKKVVSYSIAVALIGLCLMFFSVTIFDLRFDFRFILSALSIKYLGTKVTVPAILLISLSRFLFDGIFLAGINFLIMLVLVATLPILDKWAQNNMNELHQMWLTAIYTLFITFPLSLHTLENFPWTFLIYSIMSVLGIGLITLIKTVMDDVRYLSSLSTIDNLTSFYNSRKFYSDLEHFEKSGVNYTFIVLDIDYFKCFNDLHGHLVGDIVLKTVAKRINELTRGQHNFYRFGGDEFAAIIDDRTELVGFSLAEQIQKEFLNRKITINDEKDVEVTVSIGVASSLPKEPLLKTFERADQALYKSKEEGRNRVSRI